MDDFSAKLGNHKSTPPGPALPKGIVLLIEKKAQTRSAYYEGLTRKGFKVVYASNGSQAEKQIQEEEKIDLIILNAASFYSNGGGILRNIKLVKPSIPVLLILPENRDPEETMADVVLSLPFTLQKLLNRMKPLLPVWKKDILKAGMLQLDMRDRIVRYQGKQVRLTPRLMMLLQQLMEKAGEVIEREELFRKVWETDYVQDTRSLDVHISWLREALELDPRHPRLIKTIRGVGYRLDLGEPPTRPLGKRKINLG
ncbi:MAG: response regulator transcription factor [Leptolinea sp.]|nr:response regulator transcription factor [Leptolinea sp.]